MIHTRVVSALSFALSFVQSFGNILSYYEKRYYGTHIVATKTVTGRLFVALMNLVVGFVPPDHIPFDDREELTTDPRSVSLYDGRRLAIKGREFDPFAAAHDPRDPSVYFMASLNDIDATKLVNTYASSLTEENGMRVSDLIRLGNDLIDSKGLLNSILTNDMRLELSVVSVVDFVEKVFAPDDVIVLFQKQNAADL